MTISGESFEHSWLVHRIGVSSTSTSTPAIFIAVWAVILILLETTECRCVAGFSEVKWSATTR